MIEGRDIGTVVAPAAEVKVWLVADRAERAAGGGSASGPDIGTDALATELLACATRATRRGCSRPPTRSSSTRRGLEVEEVVERIAELVRERQPALP